MKHCGWRKCAVRVTQCINLLQLSHQTSVFMKYIELSSCYGLWCQAAAQHRLPASSVVLDSRGRSLDPFKQSSDPEHCTNRPSPSDKTEERTSNPSCLHTQDSVLTLICFQRLKCVEYRFSLACYLWECLTGSSVQLSLFPLIYEVSQHHWRHNTLIHFLDVYLINIRCSQSSFSTYSSFWSETCFSETGWNHLDDLPLVFLFYFSFHIHRINNMMEENIPKCWRLLHFLPLKTGKLEKLLNCAENSEKREQISAPACIFQKLN